MASTDEILELARNAARRRAAKAAVERGGDETPSYQEASAAPNGLAYGMLSSATNDPFERAALRGRESVRPSRGRQWTPEAQAQLEGLLVPQSPAELALMAGGPIMRGVGRLAGRAAGRLAATGAGAAGLALEPGESEAGPITKGVKAGGGLAKKLVELATGRARAPAAEITRAAAESPGMTQRELRELYGELGITGRPPSEAVRPSLEAQHPPEEIRRATELKLADREVLNRLSKEERKAHAKTGELPGGALLPSQEAAEPALQAFEPIRKEVTRAERAFGKETAAGRGPEPIFDLSLEALSRPRGVEQFPLPRLAPQVTERIQPAFTGGSGLRRVERAAAAADPRDWWWYGIGEPVETFTAAHGPRLGPQYADAWLDSLAGTSMVNPIDSNTRASSHYLGRIIRGEPLPQVLSIRDPDTGKKVQTLAGGPPVGYGAKSQVQHAARVRQFLEHDIDPVANPKPISYREDLGGNYMPRTVDTHDIRNMVGMPYGKEAFAEEGSLLPGEYAALEQLGGRAAERAGLPQAMQQGATWIGGGPYTKLKSTPIPLADVLNRRAQVTGMVRGIPALDAWLEHITGKRALLGGTGLATPLLELQGGEQPGSSPGSL